MSNAVLDIRRHQPAHGSILGELFINGTKFCWIIEREAVAIPAGPYQVLLNVSPKFKKLMPLLVGGKVKASWGVRLHPGTRAADSDACPLVGFAKLPNNLEIYRSQEAFEALMHELLKYDAITLTVHNA